MPAKSVTSNVLDEDRDGPSGRPCVRRRRWARPAIRRRRRPGGCRPRPAGAAAACAGRTPKPPPCWRAPKLPAAAWLAVALVAAAVAAVAGAVAVYFAAAPRPPGCRTVNSGSRRSGTCPSGRGKVARIRRRCTGPSSSRGSAGSATSLFGRRVRRRATAACRQARPAPVADDGWRRRVGQRRPRRARPARRPPRSPARHGGRGTASTGLAPSAASRQAPPATWCVAAPAPWPGGIRARRRKCVHRVCFTSSSTIATTAWFVTRRSRGQ